MSALTTWLAYASLLRRGQRSVAIAIDVSEDRVGQGDARRQVQFDLDASRFDADPRRLQVLVAAMRRQRRGAEDGQDQRQRAGGTATSA